MEMNTGSARFGLWYVHVWWAGNVIYQVRFSRFLLEGPVPVTIARYLAGKVVDLSVHEPGALPPGEIYARIYEEVRRIPYGETVTYGDRHTLPSGCLAIGDRGVHPGPRDKGGPARHGTQGKKTK